MSLVQTLSALRAQHRNETPHEMKSAMSTELDALVSSGQAGRALKVGARAPEFVLPDTDGNGFSIKDLLQKGPVVLSFYRGVWCPYCNADLQALEEVADSIRGYGASLAAISPQTPANSRKSQRENHLSFPILSDKNCELASQFGLRWIPSQALQGMYMNFGTDIGAFNGEASWALPMPARYVIAQDGTVAYAEIHPNYTHRPEPSDVCPVLEKLKASKHA
jgi:peroxiredoxin